MGIDWKRKLTSRKFWGALAGLISGMYVFLTSPISAERITGLIMATGVLCSYIFGEGWSDAAHAGYIDGVPANDEGLEDGEDEDSDGVAF